MNNIHQRLCKKFSWYDWWHSHPRHHYAHWLVFVSASLLMTSYISGQIFISYYSEDNLVQAQTISELNFSGNTDLDIRGWQQTINLQSVTFNGIQICLNSSDFNLLTGVDDGGGGLISGNFWIIAFINGRWEAGTYEYFRPDTNGCADANSVNYYGYKGGAVRNTAFTTTNFVPQQGVSYGFMISGIARTGLGLEGTNENFISNIVTVPWTGSTTVSGNFDLSSPNNNFYGKLLNFTNEARNRNIYTIVQIYNAWLDDPSCGGECWDLNPFNPANNVNPETDYINSPDMFAVELTKALAGDMSQNSAGRQFIRNVWQTMVQKLAQNTPNDYVLLEPIVEAGKNEGISGFDRVPIINQSRIWWGKGNAVDNPIGRNDPIVGGAIYRDYHDNSNSPNLIGSDTIIDTDVQCDPPPDGTIINMSNEARDRRGNYLVYDCTSSSNYQSRVINAINTSLSGVQPSVTLGQGTLIGYGGPDFWANVNTTDFLNDLKNSGANLTFVLAIAHPSLVADLPWTRGGGGAGAGAGDNLPAPNHSIYYGYYKVDSNYGNFKTEVNSYVNTYMVEAGAFLRTDGTWLPNEVDRSFQEIIALGKNIILENSRWSSATEDETLNIAKNYWNNIDFILFADEPNWDKATAESEISAFRTKVSNLGLAQKPIAINFTPNQILTGTGYQASNLDIVGTEAYMDPSIQNDPNLVNSLNSQLDQLKTKIGNKQMFFVIQGYGRNYCPPGSNNLCWSNLNSLLSIQNLAYLKSFNDPNVIALLIFSYARLSGTQDLVANHNGQCIKTEHQRMWGAISGTSQPASITCGGGGGGGSVIFAPLLSTWRNTQNGGFGWFPHLSPDGRYVAYGFGKSWITDLQTKTERDFSNPPFKPNYSCFSGWWIGPTTATFQCFFDDVTPPPPFLADRIEVSTTDWTPKLTTDDPAAVSGNGFSAADGHWASGKGLGGVITWDNNTVAINEAWKVSVGSGGWLVHPLLNGGAWDILKTYQNGSPVATYPVKHPAFEFDIHQGYLAYSGGARSDGQVGNATGITPAGQECNLAVTPWGGERNALVFPVNGSPWVATTAPLPTGQFVILLRPWGERDAIVIDLPSASYDVVHSGNVFTVATGTDTGLQTIATVSDTAPRNNLFSIFGGAAAPPACGVSVRYASIPGGGVFPDVVWHQGKIWIGYQHIADQKIYLYSFNRDLTGQQLEKTFDLLPGAGAFVRLTSDNNILWMAYRDGDPPGKPTNLFNYVKLWRSDSDATETMTPGAGNNPIALGNGKIAWQKTGGGFKVFIRDLTGAPDSETYVRDGAPTGITRILEDGSVKLWDEDRTALSGGIGAWFAGPLVVAEKIATIDDGVLGRFNGDPSTDFNLWPGKTTYNPHAAWNLNDYYGVAVWGPAGSEGIRLATFTGPAGLPPPPPSPEACAPGMENQGITIICDFSPSIARPGDPIAVSGVWLTHAVQLYSSDGLITNITGSVNLEDTLVNFNLPHDISIGDYTLGVVGNSGNIAISTKVLTIVLSLPIEEEGEPPPFSDASGQGTISPPPATNFSQLISSVYTYAVMLVGIAVFIMILWGGFLWVTSGANPGNIAKAKSYIFNAILGGILLLSSYVILYTVNPELVGGTFTLPGITEPKSNGASAERFFSSSEYGAANAFAAGCSKFHGAGFKDFLALECPSGTAADGVFQDPTFEVQDAGANQQVNATIIHSGGNEGQGRKIVILDSGYNYNHPELSSSYGGGRDFINNDNDPMDDQTGGGGSPAHGSHVAGIITADGTDAQAKGIAPRATIIAGKIIRSDGFVPYSLVVSGIYWAVNGPDNMYGTGDDFKPDVISISIGGGTYVSLCDNNDQTARDLYNAIQYARDNGVLVVVATGNKTSGVAMPGCLSNSFTVGAVNSSDNIAGFSGQGAGVDVVAPGVNIYSTLLGSNYGTKDGTSMATPIVSGIAALIKGANPSFNVSQLEQAIISTVKDLGSPGKDTTYGWGRVTADAANTGTPPPPPSCSSGCGTMTVNPASCVIGAISSNLDCNVTVSYTSQNISPSSLVIKKNSSDWQFPSSSAGSFNDNNLPAGIYAYSLVNKATGTVFDSSTARIYQLGVLESPWLACVKSGDLANPDCNVVLTYSLSSNAHLPFIIYKDGSAWRAVNSLQGTAVDSNPTTGTHTYTLRDSSGSTIVSRVVIRIEPAIAPNQRIINYLSKDVALRGDMITINGVNLARDDELEKGILTVQIHDKIRVRDTTLGSNINSANTSGDWVVPSYLTPGHYTLRVGPTLELTDVSNEVHLNIVETISPPSTGRFKCTGVGSGCVWDPNDSGPDQCTPPSDLVCGMPTSSPSPSSAPTPSTTPLPGPLSCGPATQNRQIGESAVLGASGGSGTYTWSAPGGNPSSGNGNGFWTYYLTSGTKTVTLTSGSSSTTCTITIAPIPLPDPIPDPDPPLI